MNLLKSLAVVFLALSTQVLSAEVLGSLKYDVAAYDYIEKYKFNKSTKMYDGLVSSSRNVVKALGTGKLSHMTASSDRTESIAPGIDFEGYERISLVPKDDKLFAVIDANINTTGIHYSQSTEVELAIMQGNLEDLDRGGKVIALATENGKRALIDSFDKSSFGMMLQLLSVVEPGQWSSRLDEGRVSDPVRYEISKDEMIVTIPKIQLLSTFTLEK